MGKNMKKKINYKIFILLILIIISLGSTYAWFTTNKNVRVNTLDVQVATAGNIEISADAVNWKTTIAKEDLIDNVRLNYVNAINQIPLQEIYPVSTAGNINSGKLDMFFGQVILDNDTYKLIASKETDKHGVEGRYIAFDIFLKVTQDTTIYLNPATIIESTRLGQQTNPTGIENAVRIAILNQGTALSAGEVQNLNGAVNAKIIEPNYDVHTLTGIQNAQNVYEISGLKTTGNTALEYYGIKNIITEGRLLNDKSDTYFSVVNPDIKLKKEFFNNGNNVELFNISRGITKLRIYMWIEGQDVDCEDFASGANLKFDLQIST